MSEIVSLTLEKKPGSGLGMSLAASGMGVKIKGVTAGERRNYHERPCKTFIPPPRPSLNFTPSGQKLMLQVCAVLWRSACPRVRRFMKQPVFLVGVLLPPGVRASYGVYPTLPNSVSLTAPLLEGDTERVPLSLLPPPVASLAWR